MAETMLGNVITTFERIGVYDVVLPFLLVFTVVFAILEKTRILGFEKHKDNEIITKKNLNAMVAFVSAFFVIASAQLVAVITQVSAQMVILMLLSVFFLLLVGVFYEPGKVEEKAGAQWATWFGWIMFVGIILIFLNAIPYSSDMTWLQYVSVFFRQYGNSSALGAVLLIGLIIWFMSWIASEPGEGKPADKK